MNRKWIVVLVILGLLVGLSGFEPALASTTGKIAGVVTDKATGEPLIGANVLLSGTTMGAMTNTKGEYFVINVPPGTYTVSVQYIGYAPEELSNVRVKTDLTTTINFSLTSQALEVVGTIEVVAERPLIQKDMTGTRQVVSSEQVETLPIQTVAQALDLQPGVVGGHFRGGRAEEQRYLVDGVDMTNPVTGLQSVTVDVDAIEEISTITGGYDAEYGEALSGVINMVTKKGGSKYSGSVEGRTTVGGLDYDGGRGLYGKKLGDEHPGEIYWDEDKWGEEKVLDNQGNPVHPKEAWRNYDKDQRDLRVSVGGPLTKDFRFFVSSRLVDNPGRFPMDDSTSANVVGTLTYRLANNKKLTVGTIYDRVNSNVFRWEWKYNLDGLPTVRSRHSQVYLNWDHQINTKSFYTVRVNWQRLRDQSYVPVRNDAQRAIDTVDPVLTDTDGDGFIDQPEGRLINTVVVKDPSQFPGRDLQAGYEYMLRPGDPGYVGPGSTRPGYNDGRLSWLEGNRDEAVAGTKNYFTSGNDINDDLQNLDELKLEIDYTNQVTTNHEVKSGLEASLLKLKRERYLMWIDSRIQSDYYDVTPRSGAFYVRDKMEFEGIIVKAGIRFDYFHPDLGELYFPDQYGDALSPGPNSYTRHGGTVNNEDRPISAVGFARQKPRTITQWSPRLGMSFPITDKSRLRFNYGQFFQRPILRDLYTNLNLKRMEYIIGEEYFRPVHGNLNLDAQRSTQYEFGFDWIVLNDWLLNVVAFRKNVSGYVSTRGWYGGIFSYYVNSDFATIRGVDFGIEKRLSHYWYMTLYETLQYARARAPNDDYNTERSWFEGTVDHQSRMNFLPWDRRHNIKATIGVGFPSSGVPVYLHQLNAGLVLKAVSGFPYTDSRDPAVIFNERGPWNWTLDLLASKGFSFGGGRLSVNLEVYNLTNRRNVLNISDLLQYRDNGDPRDIRRTPFNFDPPRTTYVGVTLGF